MSDGGDNADRSEEATPERREEFREKGQIAVSKEVSSVFVLSAIIGLFGFYLLHLSQRLQMLLRHEFTHLPTQAMSEQDFFKHFLFVGKEFILMIIPVFLVGAAAAIFVTFSQTRLNWSWKKLSPDFSRMNPLKGIVRMVSADAVVEVLKSLGKMVIIGSIAFLILKGEFQKVPVLMTLSSDKTWAYWADITHLLFWSVLGLLLFVAAGDFLYSFMSLEKKLKMTKEEVKEEHRKRELDPHVKSKMKRMQREVAMSKAISSTRTATVVITNPTHYAIAVFYEIGMSAPIVVAKGQDFLAQRMKEVAKESNVPILENKPLARTLYKICKVGQEIPESLYKAVSEIIRYVFLLKGKSLSRPRS